MAHTSDDITTLLSQWSDGKADAFPRLVAIAYEDLCAIARRRLREMGDGAADLATAELVHELYLRLAGRDVATDSWPDRTHFYAFVSRAMRNILLDHTRQMNALRRGGSRVQVPLEPSLMLAEIAPGDASADQSDAFGIHEAMHKLAQRNPRTAQVVAMRFFTELSVSEVAHVLQLPVRTVEREWTRARVFLMDSLQRPVGST